DLECNRDIVTLLAPGRQVQVEVLVQGCAMVIDDSSAVFLANAPVARGGEARRLGLATKQPLAPTQLAADGLPVTLALALDQDEAAMLGRATTAIVNQVATLKQMVDDFREYARTPPAQMQCVNINELVSDVLLLYGWDPVDGMVHSREHAVHLHVSLDESIPWVQGDPTQLRQVIHNLLVNACDAAERENPDDGAQVWVTTTLTSSGGNGDGNQLAARLTV